MEQKALSVLNNLPNVSYKFVGFLPNIEVYEFYKINKIDVFINVSDSEGIPVSIMEAMSFGIPVIATNVGGVSEIVDDETGILLEKDFTIGDAIEALNRILEFKSEEERIRIKRKLYEKFDAEKNYKEFIENALLK